ncbi:hypothetical protein PG996_004610 [Apiospora saccharicola]|uniref:Zn(2)-C6 fungal-type domain-containing protein n=1 Tax=Apiospora saccharicola TaxID=335842 RepID=A0ABR1W7G4_9PEZI
MDSIYSPLHRSEELHPEDVPHPTFFEDAYHNHSPVVTHEHSSMRQEDAPLPAHHALTSPLVSQELSEYLESIDSRDPSTLASILEPIGSEPLGPTIPNEHVPEPPAQIRTRKHPLLLCKPATTISAGLDANPAVPVSGPMRTGGVQNTTPTPLSSEAVPGGKIMIPSLAQSRKSKRADDDGLVPMRRKKTASSCMWCRSKKRECSDGKPCHLCLKAVEARGKRVEQYVLAANRCNSGFERDDFDCILDLFMGFACLMTLVKKAKGSNACIEPDEKPVEDDVLANLLKMACGTMSAVTALGNGHHLPRFLALQVSGLFHHASNKKSEPKTNLLQVIQHNFEACCSSLAQQQIKAKLEAGQLDFRLDYLSHLMKHESGESSDSQQTSLGPTTSGDVASALKREFSALNKREGKQAARKTSKMHGTLIDIFENILDQYRNEYGEIDFALSCIHTVELMREVLIAEGY